MTILEFYTQILGIKLFLNNIYFFLFLRPSLSLCLNLRITIADAIRTIATAS